MGRRTLIGSRRLSSHVALLTALCGLAEVSLAQEEGEGPRTTGTSIPRAKQPNANQDGAKAPAKAEPWSPKPSTLGFFDRFIIADGNVSTPSAKAKDREPALAGKDWGRRVQSSTGLDLGTITMSSEAGFLRTVKYFRDGRAPGVQLIRWRDDIANIGRPNRYSLLLYFQTHPPLRGHADRVRFWHERGLRVLQLAYGSKSNATPKEKLAGGSDQKTGLTELGKEVVKICFEIGMVVDLSHCNSTTQIEVAKLAQKAKAPITANHTCCRELLDSDGKRVADYKRNITDAAMKAIADTGGVIGIMAYRPYLRRRAKGDLQIYLDHLEHAIRVAGIDHVAVSTDGYLEGTMVRDQVADGKLDHPKRWMIVYEAMKKRGHEDKDLAKLLGGNLLRVYKQVLPRRGSQGRKR